MERTLVKQLSESLRHELGSDYARACASRPDIPGVDEAIELYLAYIDLDISESSPYAAGLLEALEGSYLGERSRSSGFIHTILFDTEAYLSGLLALCDQSWHESYRESHGGGVPGLFPVLAALGVDYDGIAREGIAGDFKANLTIVRETRNRNGHGGLEDFNEATRIGLRNDCVLLCLIATALHAEAAWRAIWRKSLGDYLRGLLSSRERIARAFVDLEAEDGMPRDDAMPSVTAESWLDAPSPIPSFCEDGDRPESSAARAEGSRELCRLRAETQRFVLRGEPGSGKSTSVQYLAWREAREFLDGVDSATIPVCVDLKTDAQGQSSRLDFKALVRAKLPSLPEAKIRWDFLTLFLDGLNEIPEILAKSILASLKSFLREVPEVGLVLTSRPLSYEGNILGIPVFDLKPWSDGAIRQFCDKGGIDPATVEAILAKAELAQMARNPFRLTMMCFLLRNSAPGEIPRNGVKLIDAFIKQSFRRDLDRGQMDRMHASMNYELAKALAFDWRNKGRVAETLIDSTATVNAILKADTGGAPLRQLMDLGILVQSGDSLAFFHETYQEYFCAQKLLELMGEEESLDPIPANILGNPFWESILYDLAGLVGMPETVGELARRVALGSQLSLAARIVSTYAPKDRELIETLSSTVVSALPLVAANAKEKASAIAIEVLVELGAVDRLRASMHNELIIDGASGAKPSILKAFACQGGGAMTFLESVQFLLKRGYRKYLQWLLIARGEEWIENPSPEEGELLSRLLRELTKKHPPQAALLAFIAGEVEAFLKGFTVQIVRENPFYATVLLIRLSRLRELGKVDDRRTVEALEGLLATGIEGMPPEGFQRDAALTYARTIGAFIGKIVESGSIGAESLGQILGKILESGGFPSLFLLRLAAIESGAFVIDEAKWASRLPRAILWKPGAFTESSLVVLRSLEVEPLSLAREMAALVGEYLPRKKQLSRVLGLLGLGNVEIRQCIAQVAVGVGEPGDKGPAPELKAANCWACGKDLAVPFEPDGVRPIYCPDCLRKLRDPMVEKRRHPCAICGKPVELLFQPDETRQAFCKDCAAAESAKRTILRAIIPTVTG